jgi:hypothetical protein
MQETEPVFVFDESKGALHNGRNREKWTGKVTKKWKQNHGCDHEARDQKGRQSKCNVERIWLVMEPAYKATKKQYSMFGITGRGMIRGNKKWSERNLLIVVFLWQNKLPPTIQTRQS